ncbi:MAG: hypothetical protein Q9160_007161 [Pyrenula sp. 1 TL-2023]
MARRFVTRDFLRNQNDDWIAQCSQKVLGKVNRRHNKRIPDLARHFGETLDVEISGDGMRLTGSRDISCHTLKGGIGNINGLSEAPAEGNPDTEPSKTSRDETAQQTASQASKQAQRQSPASFTITLKDVQIPPNVFSFDADKVLQRARTLNIRDCLERVVNRYKWVEEEKLIIVCEGRHGESEIEINQSTCITPRCHDVIQGESRTQGDQIASREQILQDLVRRLHSESKEHNLVVEHLDERIQSLQSYRDVGIERIAALEKEMKDVKAEMAEARAETVRVKAELQQKKKSLAKTEKDLRTLSEDLRPHLTVAHEARDRFIADFRRHNLGIEDGVNSRVRRTGYEAVHHGNCVVDARIPTENPNFLSEEQYSQLYGVSPGTVLQELRPYEDILRIVDIYGTVQADRVLFTMHEGRNLLRALQAGGSLFEDTKSTKRQHLKLQQSSHKIRKEEREAESVPGGDQKPEEIASEDFPAVPLASPHRRQGSTQGGR